MMSLLDYANDVNLSIEQIKKICDNLSIKYEDENYLLSETEIILLDQAIADDSSTEEVELEEDELVDEKTYDKAVEIAEQTNIDLDNNVSFQKVKSKQKRLILAKNKDFITNFYKGRR